jgi:cytochrome P450
MTEATVDLVRPEALRDSYAVFAALRRRGPVRCLERHDARLVLDHEVVRTAFGDESLSSGHHHFNGPPVDTALGVRVRTALVSWPAAKLRTAIEDLTDDSPDTDGPLSHSSVVAACHMLPIGARETTTNLIISGLFHLLTGQRIETGSWTAAAADASAEGCGAPTGR